MKTSFRRRSNNPLDRMLLRADNVTLNAGSGGDTIATEDIGGTEYQKVKLVDGTATSTTAIPLSGDLANGLDVDVTRVGGTVTVDGSGVTQPVSGTVTANLSATDNAVLDSIAAAQLPDGHNVTIDNAFVAVTGGGAELGALRVTLANDSTGVLSVDDGGGSLTVDGTVTETNSAAILADTAAMDTNLATIAGAVSGTEMQVDIVSGGTGSTQYAEDSAHTTGDTGTMVLGVRNDTLAALAGTDGDYAPLQINADGALYVEVQNLGGTSNVDTAAGGTDSGAVTLAVRDDALTTLTPADGDYTPLRVNSTGALHVTGGGGGTEYVEDAAAPANPTGTASLMERDDALGGLTPIEGDWTHQYCNANGAMWTAIDGTVTVDLGANNDVTVTGTVDLGATDNAVLDQIVTNTTGLAGTVSGSELQVDVVTSALPTGAATAANQLPDGHNVTIDNATGAAAVNIQDGGNSITVDGTVTANLGATDNAVLDNIETNTDKGASHYRNIDANAEAAIKGSAGTLHWIHAMNMTAAVAYLHLYDATTASVTPGTTTPDYTFPIPTGGDTNGSGFNLRIEQAFATAITLVVTTTTDGSTGDPGTNGVFINAGYT